MRDTFDKELNKLHVLFAEMGMMVNEAISHSVKAFSDHDNELAHEVILRDKKINECENELEKLTLELIALYQPVTTDLRDVITVLKASSDIERIGDHAVSISRATIKMKGTQRIPEIEVEIAKMGQMACIMVENVLDAYIKSDEEYAYQIADDDQKLDDALESIRKKCIKFMQNDPETIVSGSYYTLVATYLERIGDYVTNVCEWVVFLKKGKIIELNPSNKDER
ncbi:phosphate transporter PhoU [Liquorilactobacillus aquaticus DSM 21051]|uniref:Phosphate-specific transport system accessory protein PhoU n=1 Tax=Liquorilactobacillus aquaticus DSM 21051 TaxID=1423725 RepID=A0A0R2CX93_9LACO|nr:phosphate signaling complex protein PhoU [Liquorilactobacillus aquaticus]KRM95866.1 phosphate transporter PhoU [Liquorilactobacillus aquaticus DSM 21051]